MKTAYSRTWPQRLADAAPYFGVLLVTGAAAMDSNRSGWGWAVIAVAAVILAALGVERTAHYRGQRDKNRRLLVKVIRQCGVRHCSQERADYWEGLVPPDVLAEALPPLPDSVRTIRPICQKGEDRLDRLVTEAEQEAAVQAWLRGEGGPPWEHS